MELLLIKQPYTVSFAGNPVAFTLGIMPYGANEKAQSLQVIVRIEVEDEFNSLVFTEAKEYAFNPGPDGTATLDIRTIVKSFLSQYTPPLSQAIPLAIEGMVKRYRISYRLLKDNNLVDGTVATSSIYYVLKGGFSYQEWHPKKYFTEVLVNQKPFLRYTAAKDIVFKDEYKFLTWLSQLDENYLQSIYVKIGYSNNTEGDETLIKTLRLHKWQQCITPAGWTQLLLDTIAIEGRTPVWYEINVKSDYDPLEELADTCTPVGITPTTLPDGMVGAAYSATIPLTGTAPFTLAGAIVKPAGWAIVISGSNVNITGTPTAETTDVPISFNVSNCSGATAPFSDTIDIAADHFEPMTYVGGDSSYEEETANIIGVPGETVTIEVTTLTNTNGGTGLQVNGSTVFIHNTFTVTLNGAGIGHFNAKVIGNPATTGTIILGIFTITSVTAGAIAGTNFTYQISKAF